MNRQLLKEIMMLEEQLFSLHTLVNNKTDFFNLMENINCISGIAGFTGNKYANKATENILHRDKQELKQLGVAYFNLIDKQHLPKHLHNIMSNMNYLQEGNIMTVKNVIRLNPDAEKIHILESLRFLENGTCIYLGTKANELSNHIDEVDKYTHQNLYRKKYYPSFKSLTLREKEIIKDYCNGLNSNNIKLKYNISKETVKTHKKNINAKLNTNSIFKIIQFAEVFKLLD